ncbi:MAG TPA: 4a-hydroxytetrahydrobiopterin dehydratase [Chitinispirillaceae bacterium]|nr:4a-hydroxytetrahydrobiopterin dehydratase [Chitinispirillaceae bacterium]
MILRKKRCVLCESDVPPLSEKEEKDLLKSLSGWTINRDKTHRLIKTVKTETFMNAIELVNNIAQIAEYEGHHPDIHLYYNKLTIELYTHKIGGLSENDFILADKIDEIIDQSQ